MTLTPHPIPDRRRLGRDMPRGLSHWRASLALTSALCVAVATPPAQAPYSWTQPTSARHPAPRVSPAFGALPGSGDLVMFGGGDGTSVFQDTWTWTGQAWRAEAPPVAPPPRRNGLLSPGPGGKAYLAGGFDAGGQHLADFWSWDGSAWMHEANPPSPAALTMLGYDPARDRLVAMFQLPNAIFEWDGAQWTQAGLAPSVPGYGAGHYAEELGGLAFFADRNRDRLALWNGASLNIATSLPTPGSFSILARDRGRLLILDRDLATGILRGYAPDRPSELGSPWHPITSWQPMSMTLFGLGFHAPTRSLVLAGGRSNGLLSTRSFVMPRLFRTEASASAFGQSCTAAPLTPRIAPAVGHAPYIGEGFELVLSDINPSSAAVPFMCYGSSNQWWGAWPLPLDLWSLGGNGCTAYIEVLEFESLANQGGQAVWRAPIPAAQFVVGSTFYAQAVVFDPLAGNRLGITTSAALECVIGDR